MFGDDKARRAVEAQAQVNAALEAQLAKQIDFINGLNERVITLEKEHIGLKYALAALASAVRFSSNESRDALAAVLNAAISDLPQGLQEDTEFCAGINALRDEKTFSRMETQRD
jgi:uncharacterized coiled-coil protein SlyX